MQLKTRLTLLSLGALITVSVYANGNHVYRWSDAQGVVHYSQLPPAQLDNVAKVDPAMPDNNLSAEQVQGKLLSGQPLPVTAAGIDECNPLVMDELSYRARKIEERYIASRNNCDVIFTSLHDVDKRQGCYSNVAAERAREQAALPTMPQCHNN